MAYLKKSSQIKAEFLSSEYYFQSLLEQASAQQLLSGFEMERIQLDCLALLAKLTERFNGGDSSSIRVEEAQNILESICFSIGVQLKTYQSPDEAVITIQKEGAEIIFEKSQKQIDKLVKRSKLRHAALRGRLLSTKNIFYASTIVDGIKGFFKLYRPEFSAQEIHITADYPVYNKVEKLQGIEFISQYLEQLYHENALCMHFSAESIHHLLCGYDEHYEKLPLNLYEPVLAAALGCILTGLPAEQLELTPEAQATLALQLNGKGQTEIEQILAGALLEMNAFFSFSESLCRYIEQSLSFLADNIVCAFRLGTLDRIFMVPKYPEDSPKLFVSYGKRMTDEAYSKVVDEFMGCRFMADKVSLMKEQIFSLADLDDFLLDTELTAEQIAIVLKERSPAEIASLMNKYRFAYEMSSMDLRDAEKELYQGLELFASSLPPKQHDALEQAIKAVQIQ